MSPKKEEKVKPEKKHSHTRSQVESEKKAENIAESTEVAPVKQKIPSAQRKPKKKLTDEAKVLK